jgi:hypothetical protein
VAYLEVLVDGVPLRSLLGADQADVSALDLGERPDLSVAAAQRLLGTEPPDFEPDRVALYVCGECGDLGCAAITARVTIGRDTVAWDRLAWQCQHSEPDQTGLKPIGPPVFDRADYEQAIRAGIAELASPRHTPRGFSRTEDRR